MELVEFLPILNDALGSIPTHDLPEMVLIPALGWGLGGQQFKGSKSSLATL